MISVVIPNYNGLEYLKKCLEALKNQSVKDFDIIIVDDASTEKISKTSSRIMRI